MHTEAVVTEALGRVLHDVTGIVVAHRASTVLLADKVALLDRRASDGGTVTHIGTHAQLLAQVPQYRYLLSADDELDDHAERVCDWEDDEDLQRLQRAYDEREALDQPDRAHVSWHRRLNADDEYRYLARTGQGRAPTTTCRSTRACRVAVRPARCSARCCARTA